MRPAFATITKKTPQNSLHILFPARQNKQLLVPPVLRGHNAHFPQRGQMIFSKRCVLALLGVIVCVFSLRCVAQNSAYDPDDYDDEDSVRYAYLSLRFDSDGAADANLTLDRKPESWGSVRSALSETLRCPAANWPSLPTADRSTDAWVSRLSPEERKRYLQRTTTYDQRRVKVRCDSILSRRRWVAEGTLDLTPLGEALKQIGIQQLTLTIDHPDVDFEQSSPENLYKEPSWVKARLNYEISLSAATNPPPIHIAYGFRNTDLYRSLGILLGFIVSPILLLLWMRRSALSIGKMDPVAAWFSYFRVLNWSSNGAVLLWMVSGLGARQSLQHWLRFTAGVSWKSSLGEFLIALGPAWLVYFICIDLSYPVFAQLRGDSSRRAEFLLQHILTVGAQVLPLVLFFTGIEIWNYSARLAVLVFAMAYLTRIGCLRWQVKITQMLPQPLTTGELRDRVFALARKAGVKIQQVFVMPAGKGAMANAFAARNNMVIFTDYLLQRLTKPEVDAVAGHELTHLEHRHPTKLLFAFLAAILLPAWFSPAAYLLIGLVSPILIRLGVPRSLNHIYPALARFGSWSQHDLVLLLAGLAGFYFLSRRFEHAADAGAVALAGDPEAKISALLKLNRLNLMPIQWDKVTGSWLTHPSTLHRVQRIAAESGMPAERLRQILDRHTIEQTQQGGIGVSTRSEQHYQFPPVADPDRISSTAQRFWNSQRKLWALLSLNVVPPALVALLATSLPRHNLRLLVYIAGLLITVTICQLAAFWSSISGRRTVKHRLSEEFSRTGRLSLNPDDVVVGFAPGSSPRFFGFNHYDWDIGFLRFARGRLSYFGEQIQFSLSIDQIIAVGLGPGAPGWWSIPRIYVRWRDSTGTRESVFSLNSLEPCSISHASSPIRSLYECLLQWYNQPFGSDVASETLALPPPSLGEVTSMSPREIGSRRVEKLVLIRLLPLAIGISILLRVDAIWYVCGVALMARVVELIPYWQYKEKTFVPVAQVELHARAQAAAHAASLENS